MYRFIFGFQRRVWCPKCTPESNNCFMVTTAMAGYAPLRSGARGWLGRARDAVRGGPGGTAALVPCGRPDPVV
ncbi:hypothetical protein GCM10010483_58470 [Actinokineospora diospyrosa]